MNQQYENAIEVESVSHSFKEKMALSGVSFAVAKQSLHGFVGPNGAGKTTTLKILATLLKPQSGFVKVCGFDVEKNDRQVRARLNYMPDQFGLYRHMTVGEYLDFFGAAYGMSAHERGRVIDDILSLTDMGGRRDDKLTALSMGLQQRVGLARVLINDPQLLLLDEPASGLDPRARLELMAILRELQNMGKTIFISSHILSELADLCDSVTIIDRGAIRFSGPMKDLLRHDASSETYELRLTEECPSLAADLHALEGVLEAVLDENDSLRCRIRFDGTVVDQNQLLSKVLAANARVLSFTEDTKHLNQVFMDLTEPGVRD